MDIPKVNSKLGFCGLVPAERFVSELPSDVLSWLELLSSKYL